jgi:F-type H+-transporting ATPase subunit b
MNHMVLYTVASGGEHPLIDFDLTSLLQLAIFAVLAVIASRTLFRPYLKMRDERSAGIEGARAEADRMSAEADARFADYESQLARARVRADDERGKIRAEAAQHQREITEKARAEAMSTEKAARERIETESRQARDTLMPQAGQMATDIASKLLGRKVA